jgi:hypothetical protein
VLVALSLIVRVPAISPVVDGANFTEISQLLPGAIEVQALVWVNSAVVEMLATLRVAVPVFFSLTVLPALCVPTPRF